MAHFPRPAHERIAAQRNTNRKNRTSVVLVKALKHPAYFFKIIRFLTSSNLAAISTLVYMMLPLGIVCIVIAVLLIIPRTALWGALLLTGYLGGAVDAHVQHKDPLLNIVIPVIFASVVWIGLCLRNPKLNSLMPWGEGL